MKNYLKMMYTCFTNISVATRYILYDNNNI